MFPPALGASVRPMRARLTFLFGGPSGLGQGALNSKTGLVMTPGFAGLSVMDEPYQAVVYEP